MKTSPSDSLTALRISFLSGIGLICHQLYYTSVNFQCIIAWIMLIPDSSNFDTLINYFSFAAWTFYGATVAALLWMRFSKPDLERPYKVCIVSQAALLINAFITKFLPSRKVQL